MRRLVCALIGVISLAVPPAALADRHAGARNQLFVANGDTAFTGWVAGSGNPNEYPGRVLEADFAANPNQGVGFSSTNSSEVWVRASTLSHVGMLTTRPDLVEITVFLSKNRVADARSASCAAGYADGWWRIDFTTQACGFDVYNVDDFSGRTHYDSWAAFVATHPDVWVRGVSMDATQPLDDASAKTLLFDDISLGSGVEWNRRSDYVTTCRKHC